MGREGTEEVIFIEQGREVGWTVAMRMLCRYTSHKVLVSQHSRKRLGRRRMGSMLSGRPARGVHQPLLECEWQKAGAAGEDPHGCAHGTCWRASLNKAPAVGTAPWSFAPSQGSPTRVMHCSTNSLTFGEVRSSTSVSSFCSSGGCLFMPDTCSGFQINWKFGKTLLVSP